MLPLLPGPHRECCNGADPEWNLGCGKSLVRAKQVRMILSGTIARVSHGCHLNMHQSSLCCNIIPLYSLAYLFEVFSYPL